MQSVQLKLAPSMEIRFLILKIEMEMQFMQMNQHESISSAHISQIAVQKMKEALYLLLEKHYS
mgnify:CR=1 FL=1